MSRLFPFLSPSPSDEVNNEDSRLLSCSLNTSTVTDDKWKDGNMNANLVEAVILPYIGEKDDTIVSGVE